MKKEENAPRKQKNHDHKEDTEDVSKSDTGKIEEEEKSVKVDDDEEQKDEKVPKVEINLS